MFDCILEAFLDTLKILPFLLAAFLILELIEHKLSKKAEKMLVSNRRLGPVIGGLLGALPQCGFSAMAAEFFSSRVITMGALVAIFLSTSDEMLIIMLGEQADLGVISMILGIKILIGVATGLVVDIFYCRKKIKTGSQIEAVCEHEHCECEKRGIWVSSLIHTLKTGLFVLIANLLIGLILYFVGEEQVAQILSGGGFWVYIVAALVGLIPNCAPSVILTELFLGGMINMGVLLAGLLPASGVGILLLFKTNKNLKEDFLIMGIIVLIGLLCGVII